MGDELLFAIANQISAPHGFECFAQRRHPQASPSEIEALVQAWLMERPGAERGDAAGISVPWPRQRG